MAKNLTELLHSELESQRKEFDIRIGEAKNLIEDGIRKQI